MHCSYFGNVDMDPTIVNPEGSSSGFILSSTSEMSKAISLSITAIRHYHLKKEDSVSRIFRSACKRINTVWQSINKAKLLPGVNESRNRTVFKSSWRQTSSVTSRYWRQRAVLVKRTRRVEDAIVAENR